MRAMTRLAQKLLKRTRRWPDLLRSLYDSAQAKDFCSAYHQNSALHPIIAQLERAAQFERDDTLQLRLEKLETLLTSFSLNCRRIPPSLHLIACSKPSKRMHAARDRTTQGHTIKGYLTVVAAATSLCPGGKTDMRISHTAPACFLSARRYGQSSESSKSFLWSALKFSVKRRT